MMVKCLSISNPWSYLIAAGVKSVENRLWTTPYRGRVYIHSSGHGFVGIPASLIPPELDMHEISAWREFHHGWLYPRYGIDTLKKLQKIQRKIIATKSYALVAGAIIGYAELVAIRDNIDDLSPDQRPWAMPDQYQWIFRDPILFDNPIPAKGRLGLYNHNYEEVVKCV
jgi:hypothetical protein